MSGCTGCGTKYFCLIEIIDGMVARGQFIYSPEENRLNLNGALDRLGYVIPAHRRRPSLLRDPGYVALRERMLAGFHEESREALR